MKHVPHVVVAAPWEGPDLSLTVLQWKHLTKVLRMKRGEQVTYTDGLGTKGAGLLGSQVIERGEEWEVERPSTLTMAVAPPASKDRQRFLVEKLAELGVARLIWLDSQHGKGRVASSAKVFSWLLAATEQSRGAWLMETNEELAGLSNIEGEIAICQQGGEAATPDVDVVVVGPEGGFDEKETPADARLWDLGPTVLRIETAAVVAASRIVAR